MKVNARREQINHACVQTKKARRDHKLYNKILNPGCGPKAKKEILVNKLATTGILNNVSKSSNVVGSANLTNKRVKEKHCSSGRGGILRMIATVALPLLVMSTLMTGASGTPITQGQWNWNSTAVVPYYDALPQCPDLYKNHFETLCFPPLRSNITEDLTNEQNDNSVSGNSVHGNPNHQVAILYPPAETYFQTQELGSSERSSQGFIYQIATSVRVDSIPGNGILVSNRTNGKYQAYLTLSAIYIPGTNGTFTQINLPEGSTLVGNNAHLLTHGSAITDVVVSGQSTQVSPLVAYDANGSPGGIFIQHNGQIFLFSLNPEAHQNGSGIFLLTGTEFSFFNRHGQGITIDFSNASPSKITHTNQSTEEQLNPRALLGINSNQTDAHIVNEMYTVSHQSQKERDRRKLDDQNVGLQENGNQTQNNRDVLDFKNETCDTDILTSFFRNPNQSTEEQLNARALLGINSNQTDAHILNETYNVSQQKNDVVFLQENENQTQNNTGVADQVKREICDTAILGPFCPDPNRSTVGTQKQDLLNEAHREASGILGGHGPEAAIIAALSIMAAKVIGIPQTAIGNESSKMKTYGSLEISRGGLDFKVTITAREDLTENDLQALLSEVGAQLLNAPGLETSVGDKVTFAHKGNQWIATKQVSGKATEEPPITLEVTPERTLLTQAIEGSVTSRALKIGELAERKKVDENKPRIDAAETAIAELKTFLHSGGTDEAKKQQLVYQMVNAVGAVTDGDAPLTRNTLEEESNALLKDPKLYPNGKQIQAATESIEALANFVKSKTPNSNKRMLLVDNMIRRVDAVGDSSTEKQALKTKRNELLKEAFQNEASKQNPAFDLLLKGALEKIQKTISSLDQKINFDSLKAATDLQSRAAELLDKLQELKKKAVGIDFTKASYASTKDIVSDIVLGDTSKNSITEVLKQLNKYQDDLWKRQTQYVKTNYQTVKTDGNGDCLFLALVGSMEKDPPKYTHATLRTAIVNHMLKNKGSFEAKIIDRINSDNLIPEDIRALPDDKKFAAYCTRMKKQGTWGGEPEIQAFSDMEGRPVAKLVKIGLIETLDTTSPAKLGNPEPVLIHNIGSYHFSSMELRMVKSLQTKKRKRLFW